MDEMPEMCKIGNEQIDVKLMRDWKEKEKDDVRRNGMEKSKKIRQAIGCAVATVIIWSGYFLIKDMVIDRMVVPCEDDFTWVYQVDVGYVE